MARSGKYKVKDPALDEEHGVLKNKLGITEKEKLDSVETDCLVKAYHSASRDYSVLIKLFEPLIVRPE